MSVLRTTDCRPQQRETTAERKRDCKLFDSGDRVNDVSYFLEFFLTNQKHYLDLGCVVCSSEVFL